MSVRESENLKIDTVPEMLELAEFKDELHVAEGLDQRDGLQPQVSTGRQQLLDTHSRVKKVIGVRWFSVFGTGSLS